MWEKVEDAIVEVCVLDIYNIPEVWSFIVDKCRVNNGGCGRNARCTVHKSTGRVNCKCHKGYVNVGKGGRCDCRGMSLRYSECRIQALFDCREMSSKQRWVWKKRSLHCAQIHGSSNLQVSQRLCQCGKRWKMRLSR